LKLTPLEIKKQEFRKALRGFDPIEVQTFLEMVAEEYEKLLEENKMLNQRIIELDTKLKDYLETEKTLRETLLNVQEVKKQSEESSRRQADLIIKEAELKALEIMENARKQARQMRDEVNWLKSQKESFINRLRHILISQIELLSVMEIDDAIPEQAQQFLKSARKGKARQIEAAQKQLKEVDSLDDTDKQTRIELSETEEGTTNSETVVPTEVEDESREKLDAEKAKAEDKPEKKEDYSDEDINKFFKNGIQIDELIKTLTKKDKEK